MKVITISIDKDAILKEIEELEEIQVRVPNTMSNEDVEKMLINHVPELHKYYYNTHQDEDWGRGDRT
jgi:hypothetical protein